MNRIACLPAAVPTDIRSPGHVGYAFRTRSAAMCFGDGEPPLAEVIGDPMVRRLMDRDGVAVDTLLELIDEVRDRLL